MFFYIETWQQAYIFSLSKYRVTFWHDKVCIYEDDTSAYQPCLTFDVKQIEKISLRETEDC